MRRVAAMTVCLLSATAGSTSLARAAGQVGARPDMQTLVETRWEGLSAFELVKRIEDDFIKLQTEQAQQQWKKWRADISKVRDAIGQRNLLIKSGLLETTTGECKIALAEISVLLEPVRSMGKRLDRAMKREKHAQLDAWNPIYELIVKEDFNTAAAKLEEFKLDEEHSSTTIKALFARLKVELKQDLAAQKAAEEKKNGPPKVEPEQKSATPEPAPAPATEKKLDAPPEKKADDPAAQQDDMKKQ